MKCPKCQTENQKDSRFCTGCGGSLAVVTPIDDGIRSSPLVSGKYAQGKDPMLAAIMSFFIVGLGQLYNGDVLKGIVMFIGAIILAFTIIGFLAIWVWAIIDAYQVAKGNQSLWK
jgi:TM2 domain-containing membrane protein YozV